MAHFALSFAIGFVAVGTFCGMLVGVGVVSFLPWYLMEEHPKTGAFLSITVFLTLMAVSYLIGDKVTTIGGF